MKCERCKAGSNMSVEAFHPRGKEAVGLPIRKLVAIKAQRVPVWRKIEAGDLRMTRFNTV
jgi:hypothetical protein